MACVNVHDWITQNHNGWFDKVVKYITGKMYGQNVWCVKMKSVVNNVPLLHNKFWELQLKLSTCAQVEFSNISSSYLQDDYMFGIGAFWCWNLIDISYWFSVITINNLHKGTFTTTIAIKIRILAVSLKWNVRTPNKYIFLECTSHSE